MAEEEGIPEGASNIGNGVFTKRGGYRNVGNQGIELPTISGTEIAPVQDGEVLDIKVRKTYFDSEGNLIAPPVEASLAVTAPEDTNVLPNKPAITEQVESIGQAVVGSSYLAPKDPNTSHPIPPSADTQKPSGVTSNSTVEVSLKHESGFQVTLQWDAVIVTEPLNGVTTLVLALDPKDSVMLPSGRYELVVARLDVYTAVFGSQTFEHGLRYYVFVVEG